MPSEKQRKSCLEAGPYGEPKTQHPSRASAQESMEWTVEKRSLNPDEHRVYPCRFAEPGDPHWHWGRKPGSRKHHGRRKPGRR